jgi:hypothetical protein
MSARLIPIVRNLIVAREVFTVGSRDVLHGCVAPGPHRLRFDMFSACCPMVRRCRR